MDADIFISLTHFKGHETTGFGGTIIEYWHGLRFSVRADRAAFQRQAEHRRGNLPRMPPLPARR